MESFNSRSGKNKVPYKIYYKNIKSISDNTSGLFLAANLSCNIASDSRHVSFYKIEYRVKNSLKKTGYSHLTR